MKPTRRREKYVGIVVKAVSLEVRLYVSCGLCANLSVCQSIGERQYFEQQQQSLSRYDQRCGELVVQEIFLTFVLTRSLYLQAPHGLHQ